jgi:molybdate transport system substrate-binding protein
MSLDIIPTACLKRLLVCLGLMMLSLGFLSAQTAIPARPADPNQAMPAQPVEPMPVPPAPTHPSQTPTPATPATNAPDATAPSGPVALSIIADSSLKQVLQELAQNWADSLDDGPQVPLTLTNEGTIRSKIESGSTWDLVISADVQDVKDMTSSGLLMADGQRSLARNSLVIYGRKALIKDDDLDWFDLVGSEWKKVALGDPDMVASGRVAKRALQKHSLISDDTKDVFVYAPTESRALSVVEQEKADAVFLYKTDLNGITLHGFELYPLTSDEAPPIFYTAAVCKGAKNGAQAQAFILYCGSDAARAIWAKHGFETN